MAEEKIKKYGLENFNNHIKELIKSDLVNNIELFTSSYKSKLSVTLQRYNEEFNQRYHGLHPKFDDKMLSSILFHKNDEFKLNDAQRFWRFLYEKQGKDNYLDLLQDDLGELLDFLSISEYELKITLFGKAILQMASHFGFRVKIIPEDINDLLCILDNNNIPSICWDLDEENLLLDLKGIWPVEAINYFCEYFNFDELNCAIIKKDKRTNNNLNNCLRNMLLFSEKYKHLYKLCDSDVYYSGVMPRVMRIEYLKQPNSSKGIKCIVFKICRTTYATVDFMDNSKILSHNFFKESIGNTNNTRIEVLKKINKFEDELQEKYLYKNITENNDYEYEETRIKDINEYLKKSINTHTIAVSGNIITKDKYLILSKRSISSIDAEKYYCSVNGQSEFRDENVVFYNTSVFEDMPSMDYLSRFRMDLNNEIRREAIAELGIPVFDKDWFYYGISFLSIKNKGNDKDDNITGIRRMHFNVLAYNTVPYKFSDIVESQKKATEYFENEKLVGIRVCVFLNLVSLIFYKIKNLMSWLIKNRSNIFLLYFFGTYLLSNKGIYNYQLRNIIDIIVFLVYILSNVLQWWKERNIRKLKINKYFIITKYIKNNHFDLIKLYKDLCRHWNRKKEITNMHAIATVMFSLYFIKNNENYKKVNFTI